MLVSGIAQSVQNLVLSRLAIGSTRINFIFFQIILNMHRFSNNKSPVHKIKNEFFTRKGVLYTFSVTPVPLHTTVMLTVCYINRQPAILSSVALGP